MHVKRPETWMEKKKIILYKYVLEVSTIQMIYKYVKFN